MLPAKMDDTTREAIISRPDVILDDKELMRALIATNEHAMGGNIVDLRGIAMERLEKRLDRLEDTHRSVIAAAYENLAGTNQINRAVLKLLDPVAFEDFISNLDDAVAQILRVDAVRLVLETPTPDEAGAAGKMGDVLKLVDPGQVDIYLSGGRATEPRPVTLRDVQTGDPSIYGIQGGWIRSEACLRLDLGEGRLPAMLVMGAREPGQFSAQQGTDLLAFFGGVFERAMRRWLA